LLSVGVKELQRNRYDAVDNIAVAASAFVITLVKRSGGDKAAACENEKAAIMAA